MKLTQYKLGTVLQQVITEGYFNGTLSNNDKNTLFLRIQLPCSVMYWKIDNLKQLFDGKPHGEAKVTIYFKGDTSEAGRKQATQQYDTDILAKYLTDAEQVEIITETWFYASTIEERVG